MRIALRLRRIVWPAVVAILLGVPIVVTLAGRVPNTVETNIAPRLPEWPERAVDLDQRALPDGTVLAGTGLHSDRLSGLVTHEELRLALLFDGAAPELVRGEIWIAGTDCFYRTAPGRTLVDHEYLPFRRGNECGRTLQGHPTGLLAVKIFVRGTQRLSLRTSAVPAASIEPDWITLPDVHTGPGGPVSVVWARYADTYGGGGRRRDELLAYVWQVSGSSAWLWISVGLALASVFVGGILVSPGAGEPSLPAAGRILPRSAGVACVALGLAVLYGVLVPPLQAPDEPDHFLSFAQLADRPELAAQLAALAKTGHLDRIMFHKDERFRPADVGRPAERPWPSTVDSPGAGKNSVTATLWWTPLSRIVSTFEAPRALLVVRLANAALFALCLGVVTAMLMFVSGGNIASPQSVCLALLMVPTLPFFATYMSEFSILISVYVFLASIAAGLFFDTPRGYLLGLPLGIGCSLALASGRNALPYMAVIGALGAGRVILGSANDQSTRDDTMRSMWFWSGMAAGMALYPLMVTPQFQSGLWAPDARVLSAQVTGAAELLRRYPWMPLAVTPIGFAIERLVAGLRRRLNSPGRGLLAVVRLVAYGAAAAVVVSLIASLFIPFPLLWNAELLNPDTVRVYVDRVLYVALCGFRLVDHDLYLSSSFWGGFGWLDTMLGEWFISLFVVLAASGVVLTLMQVARTGHLRRAIWLGVMALGWIVALLGYAVSTYFLHRNLHGRYLVGLFLAALAVCWSVVTWLPRVELRGRLQRVGIPREWIILSLVAGIHAYALRVILVRYFS